MCKSHCPPISWLCNSCWKAVEKEYLCSKNCYRAEKKLPHFRLLDWHEDNHQLIKLLISSLKQGGPNFIFKRLTLEMFSRFIYFDLWDKKTSPIFIPAPSNSKTKEDHAFKLAEALNFYYGAELKDCLKRDFSFDSQKLKSKNKRSLIEMKSVSLIPENRIFVFVDDVLTTGATARAAFLALNKPKNFFIFSLVWRRPLQKED